MDYRRQVGDPGLFSGQLPSPLIEIMKGNGYETTSIYNNRYLGYPKGPYIDNYFISGPEREICSLLDEDVRAVGFWGYCTIDFKKGRCSLNKTIYRLAVWGYCTVFGSLVGVATEDSLMRYLTALGGDNPRFLIAHVPIPGHTPVGFSRENRDQAQAFRERYELKSNDAAVYMRRIINHIENNDPGAILFMFGDHGPLMSRLEFKFEDAPRLWVHHKYAIMGGIFPPDRCSEHLDPAARRGYMTTLDAVHAILECLSGGQSALVEPRSHQLRIGNARVDPKEFLYE